ncbi:hypothetical protein [Puniceicoccus vermicola]|uniref:Porin n=1 Tax=Puniceicoccus vermicola TaxID=388746 RepID=A0A7X1B462_9BACT|nr:hypothetical protein [Puniceicoccus vermicola]MBC2604080.1 hypothetical protein [Puniceicoccus vermicola]
MKTKYSAERLQKWLALSLMFGGAVSLAAQNADLEMTGDEALEETPPVEEAAVGSAISGWLSLDVNTHFISYGSDVWGTGSDAEFLFQPSLGLTAAITEEVYVFGGMWFDINDLAESGIGDDIQEVDFWAGVGYAVGDWNFEVTYQEWIYGGDAERILDLMASYATFLNPTIVVHNRVDGNGDQDTGTVVVLGVSEGTSYESLDISLGANVAFNTDDYYGGDAGLTYVSVGPEISFPLSFISEAYGAWNVHGGAYFYYTPDDTIPGNPEETFVTGNIGIGMDF